MLKLPSLVMVLLSVLPVADAEEAATREVRFNRDVLPILSENCFACHGYDQRARAADLRLDTRDGATARRRGIAAVVPGRPEQSELIQRITATDPDVVMPPSDLDKRLTEHQRETLRLWIEQGARYERHWALAPLVKPTPPEASAFTNPIDAFVAATLRERGMQLSPSASPARLLRRVTLDLTGLPPTLEELSAFESDLNTPGADPDVCYERVVDRLLASPHFGEHLAAGWLDIARYADTNGYFGDKPRQMWLWRDWVIDALNSNMPFDQWTIEQLAGDLLPGPTVSQRIATGFNRNHMANNETGIIDEEFRVEYVVDRVHTTMTAWLGLSAGCAQCHDHKYDPISQRDFYGLYAFFNNVPETGLITADNPPPLMEVPTTEQSAQLELLVAEARAAVAAFAPLKKQIIEHVAAADFTPPAISVLSGENATLIHHDAFDGGLHAASRAVGTTLEYAQGLLGQAPVFDGTQHVEHDLNGFDADLPWTIAFWCRPGGPLGCPLSKINPAGDRRGIEVLLTKGAMQIHLVHRWGADGIEVATMRPISRDQWHHVAISYDGSRTAQGVRVHVDGRPATLSVTRDSLTGTIANSEPLRIGRRDSGLGYYGRIDELRILQQTTDDQTVLNWYWNERIRGILAAPPEQRQAADAETLLDFYLSDAGQAQFTPSADSSLELTAAREARRRVKFAQQAEQRLRAAIPTVLVMEELEQPRTTHVLERGLYDQPGEAVTPGVPDVIAPWPDGAPLNRLGLARWLVSRENPLTPRVAANRLWQHCFGAGLVRTVDDFGTQGEQPTHPELLDWLAASFRDDGWDVKRLLRRIVTSCTYRQDSRFLVSGGEIVDPENRLLGRGPSSRLSAEMLRDQALAVSGLLVPRIGGPSVKPYQPPGLWEEVSYNAEESYVPDEGEGLWRRSLYTYIKRQAPPPWLLTFDGPTREKCTLHRPDTNTPLQALVLLNDDTYVEAARVLAARILNAAEAPETRLRLLWRTILIRDAEPDELVLLSGLLERQRKRFQSDSGAAHRLLSVGIAPVEPELPPEELAAWSIVAQTILNLDEAITKR